MRAGVKDKGFWLEAFVFSFRVLNALLLASHFEPDEYFQSVEVAMGLLLKRETYTWEWFFGVRSVVFAGIFYIPLRIVRETLQAIEAVKGGEFQKSGNMLAFNPVLAGKGVLFMQVAPYVVKIMGASVAALGDLSTIRLYRTLNRSREKNPSEIVLVTLMCLGSWLYATRTHMNSFEMAVGVFLAARIAEAKLKKEKQEKKHILLPAAGISALALYLRPTSLLVSLPLWTWIWRDEMQKFACAWRTFSVKKPGASEDKKNRIWRACREYKEMARVYIKHTRVLCYGNILTAIAVFAGCTAIDSVFYQELTCAPYEFYKVNLKYGVSNMFGTLPAPYILGFFCVLLGAYTPMLLASRASWTSIEFVVPMVYILGHCSIGHKEMRFLLPALPFCNLIIAKNLKRISVTAITEEKKEKESICWQAEPQTGLQAELHSKGKSRSFTSQFINGLTSILHSKKVFLANLFVAVAIGYDHQNISRPLSVLRSECANRLRSSERPVFVLSVFRPYMLPYNTYLGHPRIFVRDIQSNPDLTPYLHQLHRKKRFENPKHRLVLREHEMFRQRMAENLARAGANEYDYIVIDAEHGPELEEKFPEFVQIHEASHQRVGSGIRVSIYKKIS